MTVLASLVLTSLGLCEVHRQTVWSLPNVIDSCNLERVNEVLVSVAVLQYILTSNAFVYISIIRIIVLMITLSS